MTAISDYCHSVTSARPSSLLSLSILTCNTLYLCIINPENDLVGYQNRLTKSRFSARRNPHTTSLWCGYI